jgi:predicted aconitase with swiveling domain
LHPVLTRTTQISIISNLVDKARVVIYGAIDPRTYPVLGRVEDKKGKAVGGDVKISLGQMGETSMQLSGMGYRMEFTASPAP